jgi:methionine-rich copper-binding protein CopC
MTRLNLVDLHQHETSLPLREGPQANQVIAELPPLSPGVYLVRYKVLARDGHISEGEIRFTVLGA